MAESGLIHQEINPKYLNKLEKIQKQQGIEFITAEEFDQYFSF
ncbi:MAG: hypothetical protein OIN89_08015 [Candidatus Methanoperedens sp.]|jgi:hypothetical protein|nr:hypothetical protein [Candidatus Methanoperedens sp.]